MNKCDGWSNAGGGLWGRGRVTERSGKVRWSTVRVRTEEKVGGDGKSRVRKVKRRRLRMERRKTGVWTREGRKEERKEETG